MRNDNEMNHIDIHVETIVELKQNVNFLLAATVHLEIVVEDHHRVNADIDKSITEPAKATFFSNQVRLYVFVIQNHDSTMITSTVHKMFPLA